MKSHVKARCHFCSNPAKGLATIQTINGTPKDVPVCRTCATHDPIVKKGSFRYTEPWHKR